MSPEAAGTWGARASAIAVVFLAVACLAGLFFLFRTGRFNWLFVALATVCGVGTTLFLGGIFLEVITDRDYWGPPALRELDPFDSEEGFIQSIAAVGDVDRDGLGDLAALVSRRMQDASTDELHVFSGTSGRRILSTELGASTWACRTGLASAGDFDGDGTTDIVVVRQPWPGGLNVAAGEIEIRSGRDGAAIQRWPGPREGEAFSGSLAGAGDVDGDRVADVVVGSSVERVGVVQIYSGRDGSLLHTLQGEAEEAGFGGSLCALGDVDGDDHGDFAVGSGDDDGPGNVRAFSGRSWSEIWMTTLPGSDPMMGSVYVLRRVDDEDGDGLEDLLIGGSTSSRTVSARSGATLRSFEDTIALDLLPDWDEDGRAEVLRFSTPLDSRFYHHMIWSRLDVIGSRGGRILASVELPSPPLFGAPSRVAVFGPGSGAFAVALPDRIFQFSEECIRSD